MAWRRFNERGFIKAKSVVIAAGEYGNKDMVAEHVPQLAAKPYVLASTYDDGMGLRLGKSVGAQWRFMDQAFITAPFYPPARLVTGIVVNKLGKRFVAEDSYHSRTSAFVLEQPDAAAYLIVDSAHIEHPQFPLCPFIDGWETVAEMEAGLGIPEGALAETLASYNEHAARGEDPEFHSIRTGWSRKTRAPGAPMTSLWARPSTPASPWVRCRSTSMVGCSATTAVSSRACTPLAPVRQTSPKTARVMPAAPS